MCQVVTCSAGEGAQPQRLPLGFVWGLDFVCKRKKSSLAHVSTLTLKQYMLLGWISAHFQSWSELWFGKHMGTCVESKYLIKQHLFSAALEDHGSWGSRGKLYS